MLTGAGALAIFTSVVGFVYAFPIALISGSVLAYLGKTNSQFWNNSWLHRSVGILAGVSWWVILDQLQMLPLKGYTSEPNDNLMNPAAFFNGGGLILPALGGLLSAEMFRRWMLNEIGALERGSI